jgi:hypothetical protein
MANKPMAGGLYLKATGTGTDVDPYIPYITTIADVAVETDYDLQVARGLITGVSCINKFGSAPSGIQTTLTDIWDLANATPTQQIWVAPTIARVHAIVSSSTDDAPAGVGALTVQVYGLKTWALAETSEVVVLNGTTSVNTVNSYVIIHRMKVTSCGATAVNVGTIKATAATDTTVTAVILPLNGQTEMAIYGVPSIQSLYLTRWGVSIAKVSEVAVSATFELRVNENPGVFKNMFLRKNDIGLNSTGTSSVERQFHTLIKVAGPAIVKVQAYGSAADIDGTSGFDGYLVTN